MDNLLEGELAGLKLVVVVSPENDGTVIATSALVEPGHGAGAVIREALCGALTQQTQQTKLHWRTVLDLQDGNVHHKNNIHRDYFSTVCFVFFWSSRLWGEGWVFVHACVWVSMYVLAHVWMHVRVCAPVCVRVSACVCACMSVWEWVCVCARMSVHAYICVCMWIKD